MPAFVVCDKKDKEKIKEILQKELEECVEEIDGGEVLITDNDTGIEVEFPIGEIYGYTSDYVQCVGYTFDKLKRDFPNIGIEGIAYEYETITAVTFGPYFHCKPEDKDLTIIYEWQICTECGKIITTDTLYNSSQWDFEEGNIECICSPTCMLLHVLSDSWTEVQGNASIDDDTREALWENEDAIKEIFWNRILENLDEYMKDFKANKDRIAPMMEKDNIDDEHIELLKKILN